MKIFVAGGAGAIGRRLVPLLLADGHDVTVSTRSAAKLAEIREQGAQAVAMDGLDRESVLSAVVPSRPEVIIHQMTAINPSFNLKKFDDEFAVTNRLRTEGTRNLLAAAAEAGTRLFVAQSYAGWPNERRGGRVKTEEDPLDPNPPKSMSRTLAAIRELEDLVLKNGTLDGIVLRYGGFYGPGTSLSKDGESTKLVRQRKFPLVGAGSGVWSFIHIDDAARATCAAVRRPTPGIFNIVDDEPAEVRYWLPHLAGAIGAPKPFRLPAWLARPLIGEAGLSMMEQVRGSSNAKAKRTFDWTPVWTSWREGFRRGLA
ncbi:MAG TPA: NAD(P)-dependent oxidoreductase [Bryobacteraceae bacterium]|nr:NAD(P)-dependent oxidoreductase [Bryobacteraceae bacterium]